MKTNEMKVQVFAYNGHPVSFRMENGNVMIHATSMAGPFGKRPVDYLRLPSTVELLEAMVRKSHLPVNRLVRTVKGSPDHGGGTWLHEDVAVDFARWLSVDFRLWVNDRVKELLRCRTMAPENICRQADANPGLVLGLLDKVREGYRQGIALRQENRRLHEVLQSQSHKVDFYDHVHRYRQRTGEKEIYRVSQIAAELGMKAASLNRILEEKGIQRKSGNIWVLTGAYEGRGYTRRRTFQNGFDGEGEPTYGVFMVWTPAGRDFILSLFG